MIQLDIRKQIGSSKNTKKIAINIKEHPEYNSGVLDNLNSVVDYDVLIWDDKGEVLAKKIGKVSRKNLSKSLLLDVPDLSGRDIYFSVGLTSTTEGEKTSFATISADNRLLERVIAGLIDKGTPPYLFTSFNFGAEIAQEAGMPKKVFNTKPDYELSIVTIEDSQFETLCLKVLGARTAILSEELTDIENSILEAERAIRTLSAIRKESLGATVILEEELFLLDFLGKSPVFQLLDSLVNIYETTGILNISDYRKKLYTNLKPSLDNLIIARGRLEKINSALVKTKSI